VSLIRELIATVEHREVSARIDEGFPVMLRTGTDCAR